MRAGKGGSEEYLADWRRESTSIQGSGDLQSMARDEAVQIESGYSEELLSQLVANNGVAED